MPSRSLLALSALPLSALATTLTNETVLGVYMFHRHGDRTAKAHPPANLTGLGYQEVYTSGEYYRSRYISDGAPYQISSISPDVVLQSDLQVSAPDDDVLQNSATGFLQGLYPPTNSPFDQSTLRNGKVITAPMNGYQLIPVELVTSGSGAEDSTWLQSTSGCFKAEISSNEYFLSKEYTSMLSSTHDFYQSILPVIEGSFNSSADTFFNAYEIWDLINVAEIHNQTISDNNLITNETFHQLFTLAAAQQWALAYNASEPIRAIAGATLAAQAVQFLNSTITTNGTNKLGIQFGSYNVYSSFFGLADLISVDEDFYGIAEYASAAIFEMFTNSTSASAPFHAGNFPAEDEIYVRFLFHNGTSSNTSEPVAYPLFGQASLDLKWTDFAAGMDKIAIGTNQQWCSACGNSTGVCAPYASGSGGSSSGDSEDGSGSSGCSNGLSPAVNGVVGAMVTLAVVLGLEALLLLVGGYRVVRKRNLVQRSESSDGAAGGVKG